jgi:hypothetical protein
MHYKRLVPGRSLAPLGYLPTVADRSEASRRDNPNYPLLSITYRSQEVALQPSAQGVKRQGHLEHESSVPPLGVRREDIRYALPGNPGFCKANRCRSTA